MAVLIEMTVDRGVDGSEPRTEPVPPKTHGFVADTDTAPDQRIFDLSQGQRITDVHHHREADHLG